MRGTHIFNLLSPLPETARRLDGEWRLAFAQDETAYAAPGLDASGWDVIDLPDLRTATLEQDTLWYRCRFQLRDGQGGSADGPCWVLRFGGAFYETRVWLNGHEIGTHTGYFQPFGCDATPLLQPGENVLAVRCRFPVEAEHFKRKTAVAGIFADWDCKPYPSAYYPQLPAPYQWQVPLGLWQPVHLIPSGAVVVEAFNVYPMEVVNPHWPTTPHAQADLARLRVVLHLRNLAPDSRQAHLDLQLAPHNFVSASPASAPQFAWDLDLAPGEERRVEYSLTLDAPYLWFPWTHGAPDLYRAILSVDGAQPIEQVFGVRAIHAVIDDQRWEWRLNGRRIFPKGSNIVSDFYLDQATPERLSRDVSLAKGANLDLLRVHGHIAPPEFYRQCDEQGLLVMCDFPLIWTYAYHLPPADEQAFRLSVEQQIDDMLFLLGSHPSISLWSVHNEPPWTPDGSFLGADVHASRTNQDLDKVMAARLRILDPTRPVIPASGLYDQHLYHGWYTGHWRDNRDLHPAFPTEFGVQALPNAGSPFWRTVNTRWPVEQDDPTWAYAGYQSPFWASPGVGAPQEYPTLEAYIEASQEYQAFYIHYTIDQWRRQKFQPVGGYIHFMFTDCWPAISWSVVDYARRPKAGYEALKLSSAPLAICVDLEPNDQMLGTFRLLYPSGSTFRAGLYVVNDHFLLGGQARLFGWVEPRGAGWLDRCRRRTAQRHAASTWLTLPAADEPALLAQTLDIPLKRPGEYRFCARLERDGLPLAETSYDFRVTGSRHPRVEHATEAVRERLHHLRRVPRFLVYRIYQLGSLQATPQEFTFQLYNPAMPVSLCSLSSLRVDDQPVDLSLVDLTCSGQTRPAAGITPQTVLEVPSNQAVTVRVRLPLAPGKHEFETVVHVSGLGEIAAHWHDQL